MREITVPRYRTQYLFHKEEAHKVQILQEAVSSLLDVDLSLVECYKWYGGTPWPERLGRVQHRRLIYIELLFLTRNRNPFLRTLNTIFSIW